MYVVVGCVLFTAMFVNLQTYPAIHRDSLSITNSIRHRITLCCPSYVGLNVSLGRREAEKKT